MNLSIASFDLHLNQSGRIVECTSPNSNGLPYLETMRAGHRFRYTIAGSCPLAKPLACPFLGLCSLQFKRTLSGVLRDESPIKSRSIDMNASRVWRSEEHTSEL